MVIVFSVVGELKHPVAGNQPGGVIDKSNNPFFDPWNSNSFHLPARVTLNAFVQNEPIFFGLSPGILDNQLMHQHPPIDGIVRNGESIVRLYDLFKDNRSGFVDLIRVEDDQFELRIQEFFLRPGSFSSGMTPVFWYCCFNW